MRWPHFDHIFFDCDSTLTRVEGIDVLAEAAGKQRHIAELTQAAMDGKLDLEEIYEKRLQAVRPTRAQVKEIRRVYKKNVVEDARIVIDLLQALNHRVYIISGGLAEPVREFGVYLGVPPEQIRAVELEYDELAGDWWEYDPLDARYLTYQADALTISDGKAQIVRELIGEQRGRTLLIGDGYSDLRAGTAVDLFVGFGGVTRRQRVLAEAPVFIHSASLAPLLVLAAGPAILQQWQNPAHQNVIQKAFNLIQTGAITFQNERLKTKFSKAIRIAHPSLYSRTD